MIDYRNDPRYKKKKVKIPTEGSTAGADSLSPVESVKLVGLNNSVDFDSSARKSSPTATEASVIEEREDSRSPQPITPTSAELMFVPNFLSVNPTLIGASGEDIEG